MNYAHALSGISREAGVSLLGLLGYLIVFLLGKGFHSHRIRWDHPTAPAADLDRDIRL